MILNFNMTCPFCGGSHNLDVDFGQFLDWRNGTPIQNAMPNLSPTQREQLISNICPSCQERLIAYGADTE